MKKTPAELLRASRKAHRRTKEILAETRKALAETKERVLAVETFEKNPDPELPLPRLELEYRIDRRSSVDGAPTNWTVTYRLVRPRLVGSVVRHELGRTTISGSRIPNEPLPRRYDDGS